MNSIYLSNGHNSTIFAKCCDVAILDSQPECPSCNVEVYPGYDIESAHERGRLRWERAYGPTRRAMTR
jgi:hypothetical protein